MMQDVEQLIGDLARQALLRTGLGIQAAGSRRPGPGAYLWAAHSNSETIVLAMHRADDGTETQFVYRITEGTKDERKARVQAIREGMNGGEPIEWL